MKSKWTEDDERSGIHVSWTAPGISQLYVLLGLIEDAQPGSVTWLVNYYDMDSYLSTANSVEELIRYFQMEGTR